MVIKDILKILWATKICCFHLLQNEKIIFFKIVAGLEYCKHAYIVTVYLLSLCYITKNVFSPVSINTTTGGVVAWETEQSKIHVLLEN